MKTVLRRIDGNWEAGFALDKHKISSTFLGNNEQGYPMFDTLRTEVGEAVFQLKYRNDWDQIEPLAQQLMDSIVPRVGNISLVVPVPASTKRARQPVFEIAARLADKLSKAQNTKLLSFENIVTIKDIVGGHKSLKNLNSKDEKMEALKDRFELNDSIVGNGKWNALVVDDLYDSGASLEAVCGVLRNYAKINKIYVAALTWK